MKNSIPDAIRSFGMYAILIVLGLFVSYKVLYLKSLEKVDKLTLVELVKRWEEAGKPTGADLNNFMKGRQAGLYVVNTNIPLGKTNFFCVFSLTKLRSYQNTIYFITPDRTIIESNQHGFSMDTHWQKK